MKCFRLSVIVLALALCANARADLEGAKKALETVKKNIADDNTAGIDSDVKMVEFELKDAPDGADKKAVADELAGIKKKLFDAKVAKLKPGYTDSIEKYFENVKRQLAENQPDGAVHDADSLDEYLTHDDIVELFSKDEIAQYKTRMDKYRKQGQQMQVERNIDPMMNSLADLEKETADKLKELKTENEGQAQMNSESIAQNLEIFGKRLQELPQDNPKVMDARKRLDKLNKDFAAVAAVVMVQQKVARLKDNWDLYKNEWDGYQSETTGPSYEEYTKVQGNTDMHAFNMPHSVALVKRADSYMENLQQDDSYKSVATNPDVKAVVDGIARLRADCYAKLAKAATAVVEQAEKLTLSNDNIGGVSQLPNDIKSALGEKSTEGAALIARAQKLLDGYQNKLKEADAAFEANYKKMVEEAGKAWPAMRDKYKFEDGFDPNNYKSFKGKLIRIRDTDNLMGYRFKADGTFPFATTINGLPVAAKYDPVVAQAVEDVHKQVKHEVGDYDGDGKWEVIASVDGTTGRMMTRQKTTGDVRTSDGERVGTVEHETSEPVDAPIITIIAAHCGPLAVSADAGMATAAGIVTPSGGAASSRSGSSLGGWGLRFLYLIVGLVAAAAALLKANYAPIASIPQAGEVQAKLGGDNLAYIGLGCAAWGVLWLLLGKIIYGFIPNLAIIAAGLFAAIDFLAAKGLVKPDQLARIKPLGVKIGLACAGAVVLSFLLSLAGMNFVIL